MAGNDPQAFAAATAVASKSEGRFYGEIAPGWDILGNANGGYLLSIASRAASQAAGGRFPATVTGHFVAPARPGPFSVDTSVIKEGRRFTTVQAVMFDSDRPILALTGSFGDESTEVSSIERIEAEAPDLPPAEECVRVEPTETFPPPFVGKVELRLHPDDASGRLGQPRARGWFRLLDDEPIDAFGLLVAVDAFPPTVFFAQMPIAWTPTLELTAHLRRRPEPGWLRCLFSTRFISGGFLEEDGEVWDSSGRLVAQSRQLALLPRA